MYSYSSSSVSLYGGGNDASIRHDRKRSSLFIDTECAAPMSVTSEITTTPYTGTSCKSPFVTPNHPLYIFGDITPTNTRKASEVEPGRPQRAKKYRESKEVLNTEIPSPFRSPCLSPTFDDKAEPFNGSQFETPNNEEDNTQHQVEHRVIRKTTAFGMEDLRKLSTNQPLEQKLTVIEADVEGVDGLATRLRRMKRRLFLENVEQSNSLLQETSEQTPIHSNCVDAATMEGMEVVLDDELPDATIKSINDKANGFYLTFSTSSSSVSLPVELEQEEQTRPYSKESETLLRTNQKQSKTDSSIATEATATWSTFENDDMHWGSISSIAKGIVSNQQSQHTPHEL